MQSKEKARCSFPRPITPTPPHELRQSMLWPSGRLTHQLGQLCARHGEYAFTPGRGVTCCLRASRGEDVEPRFPQWWDRAEMDLAPLAARPATVIPAAVALLLAVLWFLPGRASAQTVTTGGATKEVESQTLAACSGTLTMLDGSGTQTNTFELVITGAPTSITVTINGVMRGGTVTALATSTSTANNVVTTTGGPYDKYTLVSACVGGASPTLTVNRTATTAKRVLPQALLDARLFYPTGGDTGVAINTGCKALGATGGVLEGRGLVTPLWIASQPFANCNKEIVMQWPSGRSYTSVPIFTPVLRVQNRGNGTNPSAQDNGSILTACNPTASDPNAQQNCGGNPFGFPAFPGGTFLTVRGPLATTVSGETQSNNVAPLFVLGSNGAANSINCGAFSGGQVIEEMTLDLDFAPSGVGMYTCNAQEESRLQNASVRNFPLAAILCDSDGNGTGTQGACAHMRFASLEIAAKYASTTLTNNACCSGMGVVAIGGLSRTSNVTTVTITGTANLQFVPWVGETFIMTGAVGDASFMGTGQICGPPTTGCVTPTNTNPAGSGTSTFTYVNTGANGSNGTAALATFPTYGYIHYGLESDGATITSGPWSFQDSTLQGNCSGGLGLYTAFKWDAVFNGIISGVHIECTNNDVISLGTLHTASGVLLLNDNYGGGVTYASSSALVKLGTQAYGNTITNLRTGFNNKIMVSDTRHSLTLLSPAAAGACSALDAASVELCVVNSYSQGVNYGPECLLGGAAGTASPAACGGAVSGKIAVPSSAGVSYTVNTTSVTANSVILVQQTTDNSGLPTPPTCNSNAEIPSVLQTTRVVGTSFTLTGLTNPAAITCFGWTLTN